MPMQYGAIQNHSARLAAWRDHYLAKGCSAQKADHCADRKRWSRTWPPAMRQRKTPDH